MHSRNIARHISTKEPIGAHLSRRGSALIALAGGVAALALIVAYPTGTRAAAAGAVVATVGTHKITQADVDAKIKPQMAAIEGKIFDLKHDAIEQLADQYLLEQAAASQHMSVDEYVQKNILAHTPKVTEAEAKQYFDAHKGASTVKFSDIKDRLISMMQNQRDIQQRDKALAGLRKSEPLKIMLKAPRTEVSSAGRPALGPANAPVTIIEFSDFQCPFCGRAEPTVKEIIRKYGDKVRLVYVDFPLPMHNHALDAAKAGQCAAQQEKFWPYHDQLFANQSKLAPADLKAAAQKVGLDTAKFNACFDQAKTEGTVQRELQQGKQLGIDGTPTFYINGRQVVGAQPMDSFSQVIDDELSKKGAGGAKEARAN
ncbi:MAG TPA: thioredoxin domain-containing protein [Candidatus Binataceae bacterium]|nr:thioredoxin domain-containing protein [Candidatus Binataceae bacterium]